MTPEEILSSIKEQWTADAEYRFRKYKSDLVMHSANQLLGIDELSISDKIARMDAVALQHGFTGIKDVLIFRGSYIKQP